MIVLYKPGNIHIVRGVPCIREYFSPFDLDTCLKQGWKQSPEETLEGVKENGLSVREEQNAEKENGANGERGTKRVHGSKKTEKTKKQEEVEDDFLEL